MVRSVGPGLARPHLRLGRQRPDMLRVRDRCIKIHAISGPRVEREDVMLTRRDFAGVALAGLTSTGASAQAAAQPATGKLAIIGTIEVAPRRRDELLPLLMAHKARCLKDEPGTLQFEALAPRAGDTKVLLYEVYKDDAAFDVHWNGPSTKRALEETKGMILNLSGTRCTPVE